MIHKNNTSNAEQIKKSAPIGARKWKGNYDRQTDHPTNNGPTNRPSDNQGQRGSSLRGGHKFSPLSCVKSLTTSVSIASLFMVHERDGQV